MSRFGALMFVLFVVVIFGLGVAVGRYEFPKRRFVQLHMSAILDTTTGRVCDTWPHEGELSPYPKCEGQ